MSKHRRQHPFRLIPGGLSAPTESVPAPVSAGALIDANKSLNCNYPVFTPCLGLFGQPEAVMGTKEIMAICNGIGRLMRVQGGPDVPLSGGDMIRLQSTWQVSAPPQFQPLAMRTAGYFQKRPEGFVAALSVSACTDSETLARKMKLLTFHCSDLHTKRLAAFADASQKTLLTRAAMTGDERDILNEDILEEIPDRSHGVVRVGQALAAFNFVRMATGQHWDRHYNIPHLAESEYHRALAELDLPLSL